MIQKTIVEGNYTLHLERRKAIIDKTPVLSIRIKRGDLCAIAVKEYKKPWKILKPALNNSPVNAKKEANMTKFLVNYLETAEKELKPVKKASKTPKTLKKGSKR